MARRRLGLVSLGGMILAVSLAGCSTGSGEEGPTERGFVGADGIGIEAADPSRIVTLSGDLTEFVFEIGLGPSIVATDVTTVAPEEAVTLPKAGIGRFLTAEGVLKHDPTLVIGDTQTAPLSTIEQIRAAGVPVAILPVPTTFDGLSEKIASLGLLLGRESEAAALEERLRDDIEDAVASAPRLDPPPRAAFVYSRGPDVMLLFGEGMTTKPLIEASGAVDAGAAAGVEGTITVTPEALAAAAPDVLIVTSEGLEMLDGIDGLLAIPGVAGTPAGANGRVLAYPEGDVLTFGPRIADSIRRMAEDLDRVFDGS